MKFVYSLLLILFIIFAQVFSMKVIAQGSFASTINTIKVNQQNRKQQVKIKNDKQAAQQAQRRFGGKVLKVQSLQSGYKVKLIKKDGHIISVFVDAKSGRISGR
jgi:uncharacterized membrane protein YkoI